MLASASYTFTYGPKQYCNPVITGEDPGMVTMASLSWIAIMIASSCIIACIGTLIWSKWLRKKIDPSHGKGIEERLKEIESK